MKKKTSHKSFTKPHKIKVITDQRQRQVSLNYTYIQYLHPIYSIFQIENFLQSKRRPIF